MRNSVYDGAPSASKSEKRRSRRAIVLTVAVLAITVSIVADDNKKPRRVDPAAWGTDHVGKPLPVYVTGDECLFCHRKIGPAWGDNHHQLTIRPATPDERAIKLLRKLDRRDEIAADTRYLLGSKRMTRFLKRSKEYGKLEILSTSLSPNPVS